MNKLLISLLLSSTLIGGVQAQKKENYYSESMLNFLKMQRSNRKSIWQRGWYPLRNNMPGNKWN